MKFNCKQEFGTFWHFQKLTELTSMRVNINTNSCNNAFTKLSAMVLPALVNSEYKVESVIPPEINVATFPSVSLPDHIGRLVTFGLTQNQTARLKEISSVKSLETNPTVLYYIMQHRPDIIPKNVTLYFVDEQELCEEKQREILNFIKERVSSLTVVDIPLFGNRKCTDRGVPRLYFHLLLTDSFRWWAYRFLDDETMKLRDEGYLDRVDAMDSCESSYFKSLSDNSDDGDFYYGHYRSQWQG